MAKYKDANQVVHDSNEVVHVQVKPGETVVYGGIAYGDRATLQVPRHAVSSLKGAEEVDPNEVPDVGERPAAA